MRFFGETHFKFIEFRYRAFILSMALIVAGLVSLIIRGGPNLGIDFEGGTLIQVRFDGHVDVKELRDVVEGAGYGGGEIQEFGQVNEYLIKIEKISETELASTKLLEALAAAEPDHDWRIVDVDEIAPDPASGSEGGNLVVVESDRLPQVEGLIEKVRDGGVGIIAATKETETRIAFRMPFLGVEAKAAQRLKEDLASSFTDREIEIRRTETVGPKIGEELKNRTWAAIIISIFGILVYISWRFEFKFAIGAIIALIHDVVITVGVFSLLDKEISISIVAALLTIVGYSLNDTIVVFDRIRENFNLRRKVSSYESMINISINSSLSRTIITSLTTFIVVLFLLVMGGEVIHDFAFALMVGIIVGTYSSIFVASPILVEWRNRIDARRKRAK